MTRVSSPIERRKPTTVRFVEGTGATLLFGLVTWLTGSNSILPWSGFRIMPSSDLELAIAAILTIAASAVCAWRLISGATADTELQRLGVAVEDDDSCGPLAGFGDVADDRADTRQAAARSRRSVAVPPCACRSASVCGPQTTAKKS